MNQKRILGLMVAMSLIVCAVPAMAAVFMPPQFKLTFGGAPDGGVSTDPGRFVGIGQGGLATSPNGQYVYVADNSGANPVVTHRIQKFDSQGNFILSWGGPGAGDGQFSFPNGIAVGPDGSVYVVDSSNSRVQKFDENGLFLLKWSAPQGGFIAVGPGGNIYTDYGNNAVAKWSSTGTLLNIFGSGTFTAARGLAFNSAGELFVRDANSGVVSRWDPATGAALENWISGVGLGISLAIDDKDRAYVGSSTPGDPLTGYVRVFDTVQVPAAEVGVWGSFCDLATGTGCVDPDGTGPQVLGDGQFKHAPSSLAISSNGFLYAGDSFNRRVEKFHLISASPCAQSAMDALGLSVDAFPSNLLTQLEASCTNDQTGIIVGTLGGTVKLDLGDTLVVGVNATINGGAQKTVAGNGSGLLVLGAGAQVDGSLKSIDTVLIAGPGVTVTGGMTGIGTLIYLPGASLTVGGALDVGETIQL